MTAVPFAEPHSTSHARIRSPVNVPSMRGRRNSFSITPSNVPKPPIGIAPVRAPKAVMIPASSRSLSCQSALRTLNWMREASP